MLVHVDDLLIASDNDSLISLFKRMFSEKFNVKDLGSVGYGNLLR